ncbi:MAG: cysteine synthase family protein [Acinetobacter sp.]
MHPLIGKTPCILIPRSTSSSEIYIKLEEYNWGGSIKSRVGYQMIIDAEEDDRIDTVHPERNTIIEGTGGNTGIGIAQMCALRGYKCILVVPDNYSKLRVEVLKRLGAEVILSDHTRGNCSHFETVDQILEVHPEYIHMNQLSNSSNPKAHYIGTGPEILSQVEGITHFVAGVGSGGTLTGTGRALKEHDSSIKIIAVQPAGCDILSGIAVPHIIEGIAIGRVPSILDQSLINAVITVSDDEVVKKQETLAKSMGLFLGYSSIANILACKKLAQNEEGVYVTVAPDGGRNYL